MLAQKTDRLTADGYISNRVYSGRRQISKQDADVNRRAINDAFTRMENNAVREEDAHLAS